jgi:hypothetical protein
MTASFQSITLDTNDGDNQAVLVLRDGNLVAVLSHLSALHGEMAGKWFVETMFGTTPPVQPRVFTSPDEFVVWLDEEKLSRAATL